MPLTGDVGNAQDLVEIQNIRDGTVILKNGGIRQILMVGGVNFSLKSEDEQNIITQAYQNFLNSVNFPLQTIIHSRKINIEKYLLRLDEFKAQEPSGLLQDQISEYQEFVRGFIKDNDIMAKTFFVVVPYAPIVLPTNIQKSSFFDSLPFVGKKPGGQSLADVKRDEEREAQFQENMQQLKQRVSQVAQGLFAVGLEALPLNDDQLVELFYNFYNPESIEKGSAAASVKN